MFKLSEKQHTRWLLAALAAPVTQAASNCSWPAALCIALLCLAVTAGLQKLNVGDTQSRILSALQWLWMLLVISEFLHWILFYWPSYGSYHAVPLIILALGALSAAKGAEKASAVAGLLYWALIGLLGTVLLSGIREIELSNLKPHWDMQTAYLIVVML